MLDERIVILSVFTEDLDVSGVCWAPEMLHWTESYPDPKMLIVGKETVNRLL